MDDKPLRRSPTTNEMSKNGWYQDRTTGDIFVAADPGVSDVELSYDDFAFGGNARDVAIRGLIIEYYASFAQHGAIAGQDSSSWLLEQNNVKFNSGAGIRTGDRMRILNNLLDSNGQIGITGAGRNVDIEANEIANNNTHGFSRSWEAGGAKLVVTDNLLFLRNCVHDNLGPGIWTDIDNLNSTIMQNSSIRNSGAGIFHEISGPAAIIDNLSAFNGYGENSPWGSQILVSGSLDTLVWRNKVRVNANYGNGIFIVEEGRQKTSNRVSDSSEYVSRGNIVLNNEISFDGAAGKSGLANTKGDSSHLANLNRFEDNVVSTPKSELRQFPDRKRSPHAG